MHRNDDLSFRYICGEMPNWTLQKSVIKYMIMLLRREEQARAMQNKKNKNTIPFSFLER